MTSANADRIALREGDASQRGSRSDDRPSFAPHVRSEAHGVQSNHRADGPAHDRTITAPTQPIDEAQDPLRTRPVPSADVLFGQGATIYPQGLAVVGYLSMLPMSHASPAATAAIAGDSTADPVQTLAMPPEGAAGELAGEETLHGGPSPIGNAIGRPCVAGGTEDGIGPVRSPWTSADIGEWLMRRISFTGEGHRATLRLRDYRIRPGDDRALAERLLAFAHANRWPAARIVVNGRELWRRSDDAVDEKGKEL
jgi:hypothetical protein